MIDLDKIPISTYLQLVELMGKEEAEGFIKNENYNYRIISIRILYLQIRSAIKKRPKLFLLILIVIIIAIVYYYLDMYLII